MTVCVRCTCCPHSTAAAAAAAAAADDDDDVSQTHVFHHRGKLLDARTHSQALMCVCLQQDHGLGRTLTASCLAAAVARANCFIVVAGDYVICQCM